MINAEFYPTPASLLDKIYADNIELFRKLNSSSTVLEPSAGMGGIIEWMQNLKDYRWGYDTAIFGKVDYDCIELDKELRATLKGKGCHIVHDNFLTFETYKEYDLIIMNPPFSNGVAHLLKAIALQERYGGDIICIINAETIRNQFSTDRKILAQKLKKYEASISYFENAFMVPDSERKTAVEVAVVVLTVPKPTTYSNSFVFDNLDKAEEVQLGFEEVMREESNSLIPDGLEWINTYVQQFNSEVKAGLALMREYAAYTATCMDRFKLRGVRNDSTTQYQDKEVEDFQQVIILQIAGKGNRDRYGNDRVSKVNEYLKQVRNKYWMSLFDNPKFTRKLTSKMRDDLYKTKDDMWNYDFTLHNIFEIMNKIRENTLSGIENSIMALFSRLSADHCYINESSPNIHYYNGWKTNKAHKVNKKVILPMQAFDYWRYSGKNEYNLRGYNVIDTLTDMSKALDYLAEPTYANIDTDTSIRNVIELNFKQGISSNIETKYFILTFYKKGTCHITFKDDELLEKFNLFAGKQKNWLPPDYGRKAYSEMNEEEKEIVKEFSGTVDNYNKIYNRPEFYLTEKTQLLLGAGI